MIPESTELLGPFPMLTSIGLSPASNWNAWLDMPEAWYQTSPLTGPIGCPGGCPQHPDPHCQYLAWVDPLGGAFFC